MAAIEINNLSKRFGDVEAVRELSLEIDRGEMIALVGPSGCGKTTLLRMIAGFERPDTGDILFTGKSVLAEEPERRRVGIVFQDYALFPHMTVGGNIGYGLKFSTDLSRSNRGGRVEELLDIVGLAGYGDRAPHELSAGQQQRVALARALAPNPKILLLDEPLSALDALLREELRMEIRRVQKELGITTLHVTHDQEEAIAIADRVAVMKNGRIEQVGPPYEVYFRPRTDFVARFIGRGNLLAGTVVAAEAERLYIKLAVEDTVEVPRRGLKCRPGEPVKLLIRPDRIVCGAGRKNRIRGRIEGVEFLGEVSRLRVGIGCEFAHVLIDSREAADWEKRMGAMAEVSFQPSDGWVIPQGPDRGMPDIHQETGENGGG